MSGSLRPASRLAKREPVLNSTDKTTPDPGKLFRIRTVSLLAGARDAPPFRGLRPRCRPARADAGGPGGSPLAQGLLPPRVLVERRPGVVAKTELRRRVWPDRVAGRPT